MEFFEKLGKKASETYKSAAEKTNKLASETKLKLKISDNKSKIKDIYTEIGKKVYQKYTLDENLCIKEDIKEELERIDELSNEIKEFERQKLELSDIKQCVNCKNEIDVSAKLTFENPNINPTTAIIVINFNIFVLFISLLLHSLFTTLLL